ncbi:MAG TPA: DUF4249 family protein, partial [Puia sp.]
MRKRKSKAMHSLLLLLAMAAMTLAACKKVINVNLNNSTPQLVIEGEVTNARGPFQVRISKTVDFSADNVYPPVTNAQVFLTDSNNGIVDH